MKIFSISNSIWFDCQFILCTNIYITTQRDSFFLIQLIMFHLSVTFISKIFVQSFLSKIQFKFKGLLGEYFHSLHISLFLLCYCKKIMKFPTFFNSQAYIILIISCNKRLIIFFQFQFYSNWHANH